MEADDSHYLRHITALGQRQAVVTHTAIFSRTGIKLVETGVAINPELYEKLSRHKLLPSIDECLSVQGQVTAAELARGIETMIDQVPIFGALVGGVEERRRLVAAIAGLPLAAPLAFKLTVAREERPDVFRHSLQVACCAAGLAMQTDLGERWVMEAAAAGLFHDLGLLHVPPQILDSRQPLSESERHHLYAHPLVAHVMLAALPEWRGSVASAVVEHHERLDGSGYPRGLEQEQLSLLGQLLAVAEVTAAVVNKGVAGAASRGLHVILGMNVHKLNTGFAEILLGRLQQLPGDRGDGHTALGDVLARLVIIATAIDHWLVLRAATTGTPLVEFIDGRVECFRHSMADVGVDLQNWTTIDGGLESDSRTVAELASVAGEAIWQLYAIAQEVRRRQQQLLHPGQAAPPEVEAWLARVETLEPV